MLPPPAQPSIADPSALRMSAGMRLVLAVVALAVTYIDPSEPNRFAAATYAVLTAYVFFSALLLIDLILWQRISPLAARYADWIDVAFYIALIGLSGGNSSTYFTLLFFAILSTSFRLGFRAGLAVTTVSAVLFVAVGYTMRPDGAEFDLNRFLLRSSALLLLGHMIAYWGGHELRLKRRLTLLKEISNFSNPRFGIDRTLAVNMERLRAFFCAEACVVALQDVGGQRYELRRSVASHPEAASRPTEISRELAGPLLQFPAGDAIGLLARPTRWWPQAAIATAVSPGGGGRRPADAHACREAAELLGAGAFLSVPLHVRNRFRGRLFLTAASARFHPDDLEFLLQAIGQITPIMDHIALVDRMATRASEDERRRIALDIHDRFIQPYVGIQLGISSLRPLVASGAQQNVAATVDARVTALEEMTRAGIRDLRAYVDRLRFGAGDGDGLPHSLRRFVERYSELTGIAITIDVGDDLHLSERLAAEAFSIVSEGLSNIRRHTEALCGCVHVKKVRDRVAIRIENKVAGRTEVRPFVPASIAARVEALHGQMTIEPQRMGCTSVMVEIPL